jgi:hypothetical protein
MLYMANWGSRQLTFRFPQAAFDLQGVRTYCQPSIVEDYVSLSTVDEYVILNIAFYDEEEGGWVEGAARVVALDEIAEAMENLKRVLGEAYTAEDQLKELIAKAGLM